MKDPDRHSARFGVPLSAVPIALALGILLFIQGRMDMASIAIHIVPLSVLFGLISASSKYICRALPVRRGPFRSIAVIHLLSAGISASLWPAAACIFGWGISAVTDGAVMGIETPKELLIVFSAGVVAYLWSVTGCYLTMAVEDAVRAENRAVESQCLALDAELKALRAKLHPHFLFNSLNSIAALTAVDSGRARDMCIYLSDFLRHSLSFSNRTEIRLAEEVALVRAYLSVEQIRFSDKMTVREQIEPDVDDILVPPLLLQPLAENAVKYGVAGMEADGWIDMRISKNEGRVVICIENPVDPDAPKSRGTGHGLAIVRERLQNLFGDTADLTTRLENRKTLVFIAKLILPVTKEQLS